MKALGYALWVVVILGLIGLSSEQVPDYRILNRHGFALFAKPDPQDAIGNPR